MFSHIMVGANDVDAAKRFYDALLEALGYEPGTVDDRGRCFHRTRSGTFAISKPIDGAPASPANGGTIGFLAKEPAAAQAAHAAGIANGGTTCEDPPGVRDAGARKMYLAYVRDPTGNKICILHAMK